MTLSGAAIKIALALAATAHPPARQDHDGWDFAADPATSLAIASVEYESGVKLQVQCLDGALSVALTGLPSAMTSLRRLDREFEGGRIEATWWDRSPDGTVMFAGVPARYARSYRQGGALVLAAQTAAEEPMRVEIALPANSDGLDRVLTACGLRLTTPFDQAPAGDDFLTRWPMIEPAPSAFRRHDLIQITVDCLIRNSRLAACESELQRPHDPEAGAATARGANGKRLQLTDPVAAEGHWLQIVVTGNRRRL